MKAINYQTEKFIKPLLKIVVNRHASLQQERAEAPFKTMDLKIINLVNEKNVIFKKCKKQILKIVGLNTKKGNKLIHIKENATADALE